MSVGESAYEVPVRWVKPTGRPSAVVANIAICLIHQTNYLIDQQLRRLEKNFIEQGGRRAGYRQQDSRAASWRGGTKWGHVGPGYLGCALGLLGGQACVDPFDQVLRHGVGLGQ